MKATQIFLDVYDAAEMLLLSTRRVRLLVKQGQLPHVALPNGEIRFVEADLLTWIDAHKQSAQEAAQ
jgi:predicted DNA-binding transcriptional regulator AlpA